MSFGEKLSLLRKQRGMTQMELAEELDVSRQAISRWENGVAFPSLDNLISIGKLFDVSVDALTSESSSLGYDGQNGENKNQSEDVPEKTHYNQNNRIFYFIGHVLLSVIVSAVIVCFILGVDKNGGVKLEGGEKVQGQEENTETEEEIIFSSSWAADGVDVYVERRDGTFEKLPEFSELFPEWDIPKSEPEQEMDQAAYYIDNTGKKECFK